MRIKKRFGLRCRCGVMYMFACVCILCGCTKREQLLLDETTAAAEAERDVIVQDDGRADDVEKDAVTVEKNEPVQNVKQEIYVHICGAVNVPGVFILPEGSRVCDAVRAAGGFTADASQDYINQAQIITDGCKIQIPTMEEAETLAEAWDAAAAGELLVQAGADATVGYAGEETDGKVNINTADTAQLCTVNGIGEGRAAAIVKYRESHGSFQSIEEIMNVDGIKQGVFEKIKDQISVR